MQRTLRGVAAANGVAIGFAAVLRDPKPQAASTVGGGAQEQRRAARALALVAKDLQRWATAARDGGSDDEAEILGASRLIAEDPVLREYVAELAAEAPADVAVAEATTRYSRALETLSDPVLVARASDVHEVGRRAIRMLARSTFLSLPSRPTVVFARDVGPADVTEWRLISEHVLGIAVVEGGTTSHAAIMARGLGIPLVVGVGPDLLLVADGEPVCVDGNDGVVVIKPDSIVRRRAESVDRRAASRRRSLRNGRAEPITSDGRAVEVLFNANVVTDVHAGLAAGAPGVGLLRTELAFLQAAAWPTRPEHLAVLRPMLAPLADRRVTVRTLDFGDDKTPPFLTGASRRGLDLTLSQPQALSDQLQAILAAGRNTRLRVLFPLVKNAAEFEAGASILRDTLESVDWIGQSPSIGAMIETPEAVDEADEIAATADFIALGTNDLVRHTLVEEHTLQPLSTGAVAHPRVLSLVARTIAAAHANGITVEVCGEAAGEPAAVVLLVGLGVNELSVTPGRLDLVRWIVSSVSARDAEAVARAALDASSEDEAVALGRSLVPGGEGGEELREVRDGFRGIMP